MKMQYRAQFLKKILNPEIIWDLCQKMRFFGLFSETLLYILIIFLQNVDNNNIHQMSQEFGPQKFIKGD